MPNNIDAPRPIANVLSQQVHSAEKHVPQAPVFTSPAPRPFQPAPLQAPMQLAWLEQAHERAHVQAHVQAHAHAEAARAMNDMAALAATHRREALGQVIRSANGVKVMF